MADEGVPRTDQAPVAETGRTPVLDLGLALNSDRFDEQDDAWLEQERELVRDLGAHGLTVRRDGLLPLPGSKGLLDTVVVALTSAAALRTAAGCWRAWLSRDQTRSMKITYTERDGTERTIHIHGNRPADEQFDRLFEILEELSERLRAG
ncbi:hypothetical protein ACIBCM_13660 [Streptomyces sp. NPDC051018]|uniref:effector-associated constant component EACC1 n=1 Tax=Streptomyces sp. NPDC051018 TaxID=3365639 RepID=UPI0037A46BD3